MTGIAPAALSDDAILTALYSDEGPTALIRLGFTAEHAAASAIEGLSDVARAFRCADAGHWPAYRHNVENAESARPYDYLAAEALVAALLVRPDAKACFTELPRSFVSMISETFLHANHVATGMSGTETVEHFGIAVDSRLYGSAVRHLVNIGKLHLATQMMCDGLPVGASLGGATRNARQLLRGADTPQLDRNAYLAASIKYGCVERVIAAFECGADLADGPGVLRDICAITYDASPADLLSLSNAILKLPEWSTCFPINDRSPLADHLSAETARSAGSRLSARPRPSGLR